MISKPFAHSSPSTTSQQSTSTASQYTSTTIYNDHSTSNPYRRPTISLPHSIPFRTRLPTRFLSIQFVSPPTGNTFSLQLLFRSPRSHLPRDGDIPAVAVGTWIHYAPLRLSFQRNNAPRCILLPAFQKMFENPTTTLQVFACQLANHSPFSATTAGLSDSPSFGRAPAI